MTTMSEKASEGYEAAKEREVVVMLTLMVFLRIKSACVSHIRILLALIIGFAATMFAHLLFIFEFDKWFFVFICLPIWHYLATGGPSKKNNSHQKK